MALHPPIRVIGLRKAFGAHVVLDDVSLEVRPGEAVALVGPNGAGKTTLLRILATLLRPSRGMARVAGYDCAREAERVRAHVGLLAQGAWVYEDLTPVENLRFWATLGGLPHGRDALSGALAAVEDRKSTRLNSSHITISYAVFCLKKKNRKKKELT